MLTDAKLQTKAPKTNYFCSITHQIMIDPVFTADGQTYEREAIEEWLKTNDTSPKTGNKLENTKLTPNWDKKSDITEFLTEHPEWYSSTELYSPKAWNQALAAAIKSNNLNAVEEWLSKDRRLLTADLEQGYCAFHLACQFGSAGLTEMILDKLVKTKQLGSAQRKPEGFQPIHLNTLLEQALTRKDKAKFSFLLTLGADVEQPEAVSKNTLLHRLVTRGELEPITWLCEQKISIDRQNQDGNTPFMLAILNNQAAIAEFLLKKGASQKVQNQQKQSPMRLALLNGNKPVLSLLLGPEKAAVPLLHLAVAMNEVKILSELLKKPEMSIEAVDKEQRTLFFFAIEQGHAEIADLLLERGAKADAVCTADKVNALHIAAQRGDKTLLKLILSRKVLVNVANAQGDTPLHLAAREGRNEVIRLLLEAGADHKAQNDEEKTAAELARQTNNQKTANLIEQTARGLKRAKLEEINVLRQAVQEQAEQNKRQTEQIKQLQEQAQQLILSSDTDRQVIKEQAEQNKQLSEHEEMVVRTSPAFLLKQYRSFEMVKKEEEVRVKREEERAARAIALLPDFLRLVVEGEQGKAEAMLKQSPELGLIPGDVTDLSKRTFRGITAFQYAVWALDWHMWTMLLKYIPPEQAREQARQSETGSWVREHGRNATWQNLIDAQKTFLDYCFQRKWSEASTTWVKQVGGAQLLLPAHVVNEYCRPDRSFWPCPDFNKPEPSDAWRIRTINTGEWFTAQYNGGGLGSGFGVCRGGCVDVLMVIAILWPEVDECHREAVGAAWVCKFLGRSELICLAVNHAVHECKAVATLFSTRQKQRDELLTALVSDHAPVKAAIRG